MFEFHDIFLRPIEKRDLEFLRQLHNDTTTLANLTDHSMVNEIQQEHWFKQMCQSKSSMRLAVLDEQKQIIGCIRLDNYDPRNRSIQVGGDIDITKRGKGYGSKMFSACLEYAFRILNCRRIYLSVLENNTVARNMYTKHGFKEEGRLTQAIYRDYGYIDYINMYLIRNEHELENEND